MDGKNVILRVQKSIWSTLFCHIGDGRGSSRASADARPVILWWDSGTGNVTCELWDEEEIVTLIVCEAAGIVISVAEFLFGFVILILCKWLENVISAV